MSKSYSSRFSIGIIFGMLVNAFGQPVRPIDELVVNCQAERMFSWLVDNGAARAIEVDALYTIDFSIGPIQFVGINGKAIGPRDVFTIHQYPEVLSVHIKSTHLGRDLPISEKQVPKEKTDKNNETNI